MIMRKKEIRVCATSQQVEEMTSIVGVDYEEYIVSELFHKLYRNTGIPYSKFSFETEEIGDRHYTTVSLNYADPWKEMDYYEEWFGDVLLCLVNNITKEKLMRVGNPIDKDGFYQSNNLNKELWSIEKFLIIPKVDDDEEIILI